MQGVVKLHAGNQLNLQITQGEAPSKGTVCEMSKEFEQTLGKMTMKGWLGVATVKVLARNEDMIKLEILEEKSEITVNDEKVDHFKVGKVMKLEWETEKPAEE